MAAVQDVYLQMPPITRFYSSACFLTTLACQLEIVNPFQLYFNLDLILYHGEVWRLATNFLYFGNFSIDFIFHMFFLVRYCKMLEEGSFRGRGADFLYMLLLGAIAITIIGPFVQVYFLGSSLTFMLVYLWGRRNPAVGMNFLGLFYFNADYLPWVLLGLSLLLNHNILADLIGIGVGHIYFFLEDVYAKDEALGGLGGPRLLKTPALIEALFAGADEDPNYVPPVNERAGNFQWGDDDAGARGGDDGEGNGGM
eukprot:m.112135 g.112135  ORF g.112135 m.112135 type:complete len:254 (+) comp21406_c0_seq1:35-796(+)